MNNLESERDYYRRQSDELGMRVLRLQEEQTRARQEARRSRTIAVLIREVYRLADSNVSLDDIGRQFLSVILETLNVDRAALLTRLPGQAYFVTQHTLGYSKTASPDFIGPIQPEAYHFINSRSPENPLFNYLRQLAGGPYLLWAFNSKANLALLISNSTEDQHLHRPFEEADRDIVEGALSVFIEISQRKQMENLADLSKLAFKLAAANTQDDIFKLIAEELKAITGSLITGIAIYQPETQILVMKHVACSNRIMAQLVDLLGQTLIGLQISVSPDRLRRMSTEVIGEFADLSEATIGLIPQSMAPAVRESLEIGEIKGLRLHYGDELMGTILIFMPRGGFSLSADMLKIFAHVVTVALQRKKVEEALRESEIQYRTLAENFPNGAVIMFDQTLRHTIVDGVRLKDFGLSKEMQGKTTLDSFPPEIGNLLKPRYRATLAGQSSVFEMPYTGLIWEVRFRPIRDENAQVVAGIVIMQDVTERKRTEEALRKARDKLETRVKERTVQLAGANQELKAEIAERKEAENKLLRTAARQTLLYQVLRTVSGQLNQNAIARLSVRAIADFTGWPHICFAVPNEAGTEWVVRAAGGELGAEIGLTCSINRGVIGRVFRTRQTQLVHDVRTDPDYRGENPVLLSELAVPIKQGEHVVAVLNLESDQPATFNAEEVQLAESLAEAIALSLENARLFETVQVELAERRRVEEALLQSEQKLRTMVEQIPAVTYIAALDDLSTTLYVSPQIEILTGFSASEWLAEPERWLNQIHPDDQSRVMAELAKNHATCSPTMLEYRLWTKQGNLIWVRDEAKTLYNGVNSPAYLQGVMFDITADKTTEAHIKASLKEKEVLLQEIHHRVKNNLQIIASLLNLQSNYIHDPETLEIFRDSQNRVRSMALIHEKLYRSENLARIYFGDYIKDLSTFLFRTQNGFGRGISLDLQSDRTLLNIEQAVPCGLIVNELLSNTLKHAFPNGQTGRVQIAFYANGNGLLNLEVTDNGIGFPVNLDFQATESLGLQLVNTLVDQLEGTITLNCQSGTKFSITFPGNPKL